MLSVRHIQLSGHEDIYLAPRVSFQPEQEPKAGGPNTPAKTPPTIWLDCPDGSTKPLTGGTIFVMNDSGKTIARYDIGASMVPFVGEASPNPGIRIS